MNINIDHYDKNMKGKDYVVGDIHGNFRQLMQILYKMNFNFKQDRLFSVGDLCDRGPDSIEILKWINYKWFIPVMGNHETFIMNYKEKLIDIETLLKVGASWWLNVEKCDQEKIMNYYQTLPIAIEIETKHGSIGIVHAACPTDSWSDFKKCLKTKEGLMYANKAIWTYAREENKKRIKDIEYIIVGHTVQKEYMQWENMLLIDTGATFSEGYFTILDIETLKPVEYKNMNLV